MEATISALGTKIRKTPYQLFKKVDTKQLRNLLHEQGVHNIPISRMGAVHTLLLTDTYKLPGYPAAGVELVDDGSGHIYLSSYLPPVLQCRYDHYKNHPELGGYQAPEGFILPRESCASLKTYDNLQNGPRRRGRPKGTTKEVLYERYTKEGLAVTAAASGRFQTDQPNIAAEPAEVINADLAKTERDVLQQATTTRGFKVTLRVKNNDLVAEQPVARVTNPENFNKELNTAIATAKSLARMMYKCKVIAEVKVEETKEYTVPVY